LQFHWKKLSINSFIEAVSPKNLVCRLGFIQITGLLTGISDRCFIFNAMARYHHSMVKCLDSNGVFVDANNLSRAFDNQEMRKCFAGLEDEISIILIIEDIRARTKTISKGNREKMCRALNLVEAGLARMHGRFS
jgi:hypothetical protein